MNEFIDILGIIVNMKAIIVGIIVCIMLCTCGVIIYRRKTEQMLNKVLQELDRAVNQNFQQPIYDESIDGAIIERLNRIVQITKMQTEQANKERDMIKSLISNISHQVRSPLTNIMLYTGLLKEEILRQSRTKEEILCQPRTDEKNFYEKELQLADKIQKQSEKLEFFMKELVKSSYTEQEIISINLEQVSVDELINKACQMVELEALKKEIYIFHEDTEFFCQADKKWMVEALGNILENAVKYSREKSLIEIKVIPYDSFICIEVKDEGIGIKEEEQGLIFKRFYRSLTVSSIPGFGIGLYLVREVLTKQGGYIKVQSKLGQGSAFQLFLSRYKT